ncbi:sugar transferase [Caulobacter segnis]
MKRRASISPAAAAGLLVLALPLAGLWPLVRLTSPGPGLYWSQRVGRGSALFPMPQFRTMRDRHARGRHPLAAYARKIPTAG